MTSQKQPRICDSCGKKCKEGDEVYKLQISKRGNQDSVKGEFVKANNDADMCHPCFMKMATTGYKPNWIKLRKNQDGKWVEVDDQQRLS